MQEALAKQEISHDLQVAEIKAEAEAEAAKSASQLASLEERNIDLNLHIRELEAKLQTAKEDNTIQLQEALDAAKRNTRYNKRYYYYYYIGCDKNAIIYYLGKGQALTSRHSPPALAHESNNDGPSLFKISCRDKMIILVFS